MVREMKDTTLKVNIHKKEKSTRFSLFLYFGETK